MKKGATTAAVGMLSASLSALVAFLFFSYALSYESLPFFNGNRIVLTWAAAAIAITCTLLYVTFYFFKRQALCRLIFVTLVFLDIMAVIFFVLCAFDVIKKLVSIEALRQYISGFGWAAVLIFIVFQFLQVVILPVPGSVSVGVGVALFGPAKSAIFSFIGIFCGSVVAFFIGRVIGYKAVCWIVGKSDLDKWLKKMRGKDYLLLSIMFLLPLFPDDLLCFVAGLSSMGTTYFLVMIFITRIISVSTTSYSFDLIPFNEWWGIILWVIIAAAIVAAFILVCKYSDKIDKFIKNKFKLFKSK